MTQKGNSPHALLTPKNAVIWASITGADSDKGSGIITAQLINKNITKDQAPTDWRHKMNNNQLITMINHKGTKDNTSSAESDKAVVGSTPDAIAFDSEHDSDPATHEATDSHHARKDFEGDDASASATPPQLAAPARLASDVTSEAAG